MSEKKGEGVKKPIVIALGGNALLEKGDSGAIVLQKKRVLSALRPLIPIIRNNPVVITHGNGPAVGNLLLQQKGRGVEMPLDVLDAETEGQIGYLISQELGNLLPAHEIVTVLTQVIVDRKDKAFRNPTKFVGPFYTASEAKKMSKQFAVREDVGRGWRRVVASPEPIALRETSVIAKLLRQGVVTIAAGGGGIPVVRKGNAYVGVEAVVDKDKASVYLAHALDAETMLIITGVDAVYEGYGISGARAMQVLRVKDAREHLSRNTFGAGSMKPKVEAAVWFVTRGDKKRKVIITDSAHSIAALAGNAGTVVRR